MEEQHPMCLRRILNDEEQEKREQQSQKEEERMREEREHQAFRPETRKLDIESRLPIKAPPRGRRKQTMSEEDRQVREKWEQRIQEEEERMREEWEQNVSFKLTEEQRRIRCIIKGRARRLRGKTKKEAKDEIDKQERVAQMQSGEETDKSIQGRQKRVMTGEELRHRAEREQAEEKLMREEREQHIFRAKKLTDQQREDRNRIRERNRSRRLRIEKMVADEKYGQKRIMAQRNSAGEENINAEIDSLVVEVSPTVDHPMS